jgi:hypothetical protein
MMMYG